MKLVVDTNIVAAAILRESTTRKLLLHPDIEVYAPEHVLGEMKNYRAVFIDKSGLDETGYDTIFDKIISDIVVVPIDEFKTTIQQAYDAMKEIDENDTPFLALALSFENDGIWSNDGHFNEQTLVKVYKTKELLHFIEE